MRLRRLAPLLLTLSLAASGCADANDASEMAGPGTPTIGDETYTPPSGEEAENPGGIQAGTLTAGAWDDNLNFDFFLGYLERLERQQLAGLPRVPRADRLVIDIKEGAGRAAAGAEVTVIHRGQELFRGPTGADGRVYYFPAWDQVAQGDELEIVASSGSARASTTARAGASSAVVTLADARVEEVLGLDVALVLDTTGSMGDELDYLKAEVEGISAAIHARYPTVDQRWALVVYRDHGDEYLVRSYDFSDLQTFRTMLRGQSYGGGGDLPEAPEVALDEAMRLSWRGGATARLLFHVADAPHHVGREGALLEGVRLARSKGVRIYPVAASGVDELAEATMRSEAQLTGGRYLFLTDDSGVGGAHKEPSLPCYLVTRLDKAMVRMVAMEVSGRRLEPEPADILRTGGNPQDGRCTLDDGEQVEVL
ncbi:MAG TPA: hypothetical protein DFS52_05955 [Myxococcales bacterium]|nr:hypothetical protein [Myxococcales bacterium]